MHTFSPESIRQRIQAGELRDPTVGMAADFVQADLVALHQPAALEFLIFCIRNPAACPLLDVLEPGIVESALAPAADVRRAWPRYRAYHNGAVLEELVNLDEYWNGDMVHILLESDARLDTMLARAGLPQRHVEQNTVPPAYETSVECRRAGAFHGPLVVTMRAVPDERLDSIIQRVQQAERPHLTPIHIGSPAEIGIRDLARPDWGAPIALEGRTPVFWSSSSTALAAIHASRPALALASKPGHRLVTDCRI